MNAEGGWRTEYRCVECEHPMSNAVRVYSDGRCPYCGHKEPDAGTIVATTEHAYRLVASLEPTRRKWWQAWKPMVIRVVRRVYREEAPTP